jgi:hypothetical protein
MGRATETHNITQLQNEDELKVEGMLSTKAYKVQFGNQSIYPSCQCLDRQKHHLPCNNDPIQTKLNQNSDEGFTDLPSCKVFNFRRQQHEKKFRDILKQMTSATYVLKDSTSIQNLEKSLCKIWDDVKESLPSDCNGLALETLNFN